MNKIYFVVLIGALVTGAYIYGANITDVKCRVRYLQDINQNNIRTIKHKKEIHETVYKTGVGDIRRILRDRYTISE